MVNKELKNLGFGVGNITRAFNALIEKRPQLVIQTYKSGAGKSGRKRYKVTQAGIQRVKNLMAGNLEA